MAKKGIKIGLLVFGLLFISCFYIAFNYFSKIYFEGVEFSGDEKYLYVPTGSDLHSLTRSLHEEGLLKDTSSFLWVAEKKSFSKPIAGRYLVKNKMSNNDLVNLLRSGMQKPLRLTINSSRNLDRMAGVVAKQLELDSIKLLSLLESKEKANEYGFNRSTFPTMFLPNTYEFYWNTSEEEFIARMAREYKSFWNDKRKQQAAQLGLGQSEVSILASIVQAEQQEHAEERPTVAGLYLNRLKKGMRLQSDPTLIFALGDYSIKRVLNEHKEINSPYNTYKNAGLPPGPINIPEISSINSVLNAEKHSYIYMCAKADFSGYHHFSSSLSQHNQYANAYRRELNRRRILQ